MYGVVGKMRCVPGRREELIALLTQSGSMPGCLQYIVARDRVDDDAIWVTEIWESAAAHLASLELLEVKEAIAAGRSLIAGFEMRATTEPVGGIGLP